MPFLALLRSPKILMSAAALVAVGTLWWYVAHLKNNVEELRKERAYISLLYEQAMGANETNQTTIAELKAANESLAEAITIREEERIAAAADAAARAARAEMRLDDTLRTLEELRNESPSCEELSRVDMGAVCPLVTERLRQHAAGPAGQN